MEQVFRSLMPYVKGMECANSHRFTYRCK